MRKTFKFVGFALLALLLIALGLGAFHWRTVHQIARFSPILLPPMYGEPADKAAARAQDIRYLRKLIKIDRSFSAQARAEFSSYLTNLESQLDNMTDADFYAAVSKAVALADNGHTNISTGPLYRRFNVIGAKLYWFADGLFVVRAASEHRDAVGSRVVAVGGVPLDEVVARLGEYHGGAPQWRKLFMPMMIESASFLHATGLAATPDSVTLSLAMKGGEVRDVTFKAQRVKNGETLPVRRPWMTLKPVALPGAEEGWTRALSVSGADAPLYLRESDEPFYSAALDGNGLYIRTQTTFDSATQSLTEFFRQILQSAGDGALDYIVVDLRWNPGGDYTKAIDFAKQIPAKIKKGGRLYIAVGPQTFSAGLVTAALLKYYGGDKSVLIGMPMGDRGQFWAETGMAFRLPNSRFRINYATGYHDWEKGCADHPFCFTQNLLHQVPAGSLTPKIIVMPTFSDYASGRDVLMDRIRARQLPSR